jgi:hypothetical protein
MHWLLSLGIDSEVARDRESRTVQKAYIEDILRRFNFDVLKPISTPMDPHLVLSTSQSPTTPEQFAVMQNIPYREATGSLMCASIASRPDVTFAVGQLTRFSQNPGIAHWETAKRVFCYLKGTKDFWLTYGDRDENLTGWVDADGSQSDNRLRVSY